MNAVIKQRVWILSLICILFLSLGLIPSAASDFNPAKNVLDADFNGGWSVTTGDMDGDGDLDIVAVAHYDDTVAWFENGGSGIFSTRQVIISGAANLDGPTSVAVGDLDNDGDLDVVANGENNAKISWFVNDGTGNFTAGTSTITESFDNPATLTLGDMDRDGDLDVIAARTNLTTVTHLTPIELLSFTLDGEVTWFENPLTSSPSWTSHTIASLPGSTGVAVFDRDQDGDLDVVAATPVGAPLFGGSGINKNGKIIWYENTNGDGSTWSGGSNLQNNVSGANFLFTGDIDDDGDSDVIVSRLDIIEVYLNPGAPVEGSVSWFQNNLAGFSAANVIDPTASVGVTLADMDIDGDLDVISAAPEAGEVNWYENTAANGTAWTKTSIDSTYSDGIAVTTGDLDGDGDPDVASAAGQFGTNTIGELAWWRNNMGGERELLFAAPQEIVTDFDSVEGLELADLDRDGDIDVAATSFDGEAASWFPNPGWAEDQLGVITNAQGLKLGDFNIDGFLDVVAYSSSGGTLTRFDNDGAGGFAAGSNIVASGFGTLDGALGDLDADYDLDLITPTATGVDLRLGNGDGTFAAGSQIITLAGIEDVAIADMDGDGTLDIVTSNRTDLRYYKNEDGDAGTWTLSSIATYDAISIAAADVNGDGSPDLIAGTQATSPGVDVYFNDGAGGTFTPQNVMSVTGMVPSSIAAADMDGDGDIDVVAANADDMSANQTIHYAENLNGAGTLWDVNPFDTFVRTTSDYSDPAVVRVGDIDDDGDPDVVVGFTGSSQAATVGDGIYWYENLRGPGLITNAGATTNEDNSITLTSAMLRVRDNDTAVSNITYTLTQALNGQIRVNGTLSSNFTQADVNNGLVVYDPNDQFEDTQQGATANDNLKFTLSDGDHVLPEATFVLTITGVNDAPVQLTNNVLALDEGENKTITTSLLRYVDADTADSNLQFTVTNGPDHGSLSSNTFTQQAINNGTVTYTHDGTDTTQDSFTFTVSDGLATTASATFNVLITLDSIVDPTPTPTVEPTTEPTPVTPTVPGPGEQGTSGNLTEGTVLPILLWTPANDSGGQPDFAAWYNLIIYDEGGNVVLNIWLPVGAVCDAETCAYQVTLDDLPAGLLNGNYTWTLQQWSPDSGMGEVSAPVSFTVNVPQPSSPTGITATASPFVKINVANDPGTAWYHIYLGTNDGGIYTTYYFDWIRKPDSCPGTEARCVLMPPAHLPNGDYEIWMQTWGPAGFNNGSADSWTQGPILEVNTAVPGLITPMTPTDITTGRPTFTWKAHPGSSWYNLYVGNADGVEYFGWLWGADLGCSNSLTCTAVPGMVLSNNATYDMWLRSWGPGGFSVGGEYEGWQQGPSFEVSVSGTTATPELIAPQNLISTANPVFSWTSAPNASWYRIKLANQSLITQVDVWIPREDLTCDDVSCSYQFDDLRLPDGNYVFYVTAYAPTGLSDESDGQTFAVGR